VVDRPLVGVDIGGTKLLLVALWRGDRELHRVPTGPGIGPEFVEREIRSFFARFDAPPAALGVAVPGLVDEGGVVTACDTYPRLEGWRAEEAFADLSCPVRVLNDVDAALVEETHDLARDATVAFVMAGTWIGAAVQTNGALLRGARGWAGEFGYAPIAVEGGRVARLDDLAGGGAIARRLGTDGAGLYERAVGGDATALAAVQEAGIALGLGLATLMNLLNPDLLVLGGGAFKLPGYREAALQIAERYALPDSWRVCAIRTTRAGAAVVALGAAREAARASSA
jgi:glucokinase